MDPATLALGLALTGLLIVILLIYAAWHNGFRAGRRIGVEIGMGSNVTLITRIRKSENFAGLTVVTPERDIGKILDPRAAAKMSAYANPAVGDVKLRDAVLNDPASVIEIGASMLPKIIPPPIPRRLRATFQLRRLKTDDVIEASVDLQYTDIVMFEREIDALKRVVKDEYERRRFLSDR